MELVVHDQLQKYFLETNLISHSQFEISPTYSTADLPNILSWRWNQQLGSGVELVVILQSQMSL